MSPKKPWPKTIIGTGAALVAHAGTMATKGTASVPSTIGIPSASRSRPPSSGSVSRFGIEKVPTTLRLICAPSSTGASLVMS
jgi:hypothetical protein